MAVITFSRQFGSGGDRIAEKVSQALGYSLFNKEMVDQAAHDEGISGEELLDFADNYKIKGFLERLFSPQYWVDYSMVWNEDMMNLLHPLTEERALFLIQKAVKMACDRGNTVIVGRGSQALLQTCSNVVHVRLVAPMETRIQSVKADYHLDRRPAQDLIEERDQASMDYVKRMYHVDWADPDLYNLIINTEKVPEADAVQLILQAVRLLQPEHAVS